MNRNPTLNPNAKLREQDYEYIEGITPKNWKTNNELGRKLGVSTSTISTVRRWLGINYEAFNVMDNCSICGELYHKKRVQFKTCSPQCQIELMRQQKGYGKRKVREKEYGECLNCGKRYLYKGNRGDFFCCRKCYLEYLCHNKYVKMTCPTCHKVFQTTNRKPHIYCGDDCRRQMLMKRKVKPVKNTCRICGRESYTNPSHATPYCSQECYLESKRIWTNNRLKTLIKLYLLEGILPSKIAKKMGVKGKQVISEVCILELGKLKKSFKRKR